MASLSTAPSLATHNLGDEAGNGTPADWKPPVARFRQTMWLEVAGYLAIAPPPAGGSRSGTGLPRSSNGDPF
jgi:hypothetical protein